MSKATILKSLTALLLVSPFVFAEPITTSWFTDFSGQYARTYPTTTEETANTPAITWTHPTGSSQASPTYAGVSEISTTATDLYIRTSGLAFHIMGPWYGENGNLFPNYPANIAQAARFPLTPIVSPLPKTLTGGGAIGYFVDGVAMFDSRDAFSYSITLGRDATPADGANRGDGVWNRDAYVNESDTFDPANAHQAGATYHYHANPTGLRYLLADSVSLNSVTNRYTESPNNTHSPILAWTFDGFPVYGPYGYSVPLNPASGVRRMISGYQKRDGSNGSVNLSITGRTSLPAWITRNESTRTNPPSAGPSVNATYTLGHYLEDYDYKGDLGFIHGTHFDLNEYNVRWCVTPEFPNGTYAYFSCIAEDGTPVFPYNISRYYFGTRQGANVATLPATRDILFEGGPEAKQKIDSPTVNSTSGNVTLTWSGVEGGTYLIERSDNLTDWKTLDDSASPNAGSFGENLDANRATTAPKQFYRSSLNGIASFDDTGFDYTEPVHPTFTATFDTLPTGITSVTVGGVSATIVGTVGNSLMLTFAENTISAGSYAAVVTATSGSVSSTNTHTVSPKRNILLLILDDWGIDSSPIDSAGTAGATFPPMPNLEALAARGLRFTNAYTQPVCSPTRACIITGRYGFRNSVGHPAGQADLPSSELTLPEIFTAQSSGYSLASFGKWHLGGGNNGPSTLGGWPEFRGLLGGAAQNYYSWTKTINGTNSTSTTYTTTDQVNDAVNFISTQGSTPWFVWLAFNAPHDPFHNPPSSLHDYPAYAVDENGEITAAANRRNAYEASLQALDTEIGRLLSFVNLNTTDIILIGDNGTPSQVIQAPFTTNHAKDTLYEGGIHVPLVIAGPSVKTTGTSTRLVHCVDLFSTILELARINVATATSSVSTIDSQSLLPILKGQDTTSRHIVSERFGGTTAGDGRAIVSASFPDYKMIIFGDPSSGNDTSTYQMFNITTDPNELSPLTLPPAITAAHYAAWQALTAKDLALGPAPTATPVTLTLTLPTITGSAGVPANLTVTPTTIIVNGSTTATYVSRPSQFILTCTVPSTLSPPYTTATVTFPNNPNTQESRVFTTTQITASP